MNLAGLPLAPEDYRRLSARGIDRETADRSLLRRVDSQEGAEIVGRNGSGNYAGLLIPYVWPGEDRVREYRLRRDSPEIEYDANGRPKERGKYLSPPGRSNLLFVPVGVDPLWLADPAIDLTVTEGELKATALWRAAWHGLGDSADRPRFLPLGLAGVWNWRGTVGKTTNATGARVDVKGAIPDLDRIEWKRRRVTIIFDRDGETNDKVKWARDLLAKELRRRGGRVHIFQWPDVEEKGIDDLLAAIGPDLVLKLIERAPVAEASQSDPSKSKSGPIYTYADVPSIWDYESEEVRYIIRDLLPEAAITLITGDSGHGKSIFASAMAGAIIAGGEFLGRQAERRKVIYLDRENGLALVKKHLFDLHIERTPDLIYWGNWCEFPPDGPASVSLLEFAHAEKPVMIFDSLVAYHTGDEQDASETRRFLQYFRNLAAAGASVILLHHIGKSDNARQYRGSTDIKASVDVAWLLEKLGDPAGLLTDLRLIPFKNRIGTHNTIPLSFRGGLFITEQRPESNREIFERIVRLNPNSTGSEIEKLGMAAGLSKNRIAQLLLDGVQQGWLQMKLGKRNAKHYSLAEAVLGEI